MLLHTTQLHCFPIIVEFYSLTMSLYLCADVYLECGGTTPLFPGDSAVGKADDDPEGRQPLAGGFAKRYPRVRWNPEIDPGGITAWI